MRATKFDTIRCMSFKLEDNIADSTHQKKTNPLMRPNLQGKN